MKAKVDSTEKRKKLLEYYDNRRKYEVKRMLDQRYTSIKQRCEDNIHHPSSAYGLLYLSKKEFLDWYEETKDVFDKLYKAWQDGGFTKGLAPSVDRIDSKKGYTVDNMQWLDFSANIKKGVK